MIRASVPLMQAALTACRGQGSRSPVEQQFAQYLESHIPEEEKHDEWVLRDLEVLGYDTQAILSRMPSSTIASVVGAQYYWIYHYKPLALLGYIAILEGYPPEERQIRHWIDKTALPEAAFRTLLKHALLDREHRRDLDHVLDDMPLTSDDFGIIGTSAFCTAKLLAHEVYQIVVNNEQL